MFRFQKMTLDVNKAGMPIIPVSFCYCYVMCWYTSSVQSMGVKWKNSKAWVRHADDTILFFTDNRALNELLHLTEVISSKYGLCLNKNKCVAIQMNNDGSVHFDNQEPLPKRFETTYLGNEINREANIWHEILNKMQEVRKTWFRLLPYWKATNANLKWQLLIFDAVMKSKIIYGLETVHLTQAMMKKSTPSSCAAWENSWASADVHR